MYVPDQLFQILFLLDQNCAVPAFKQMSATMSAKIKASRILAGQKRHCLRQRRISRLNRHVYMVGHPAKRVQSMPILAKHPLNDGLPDVAIMMIQKQVLLRISPHNHMVKAAGNVDTGFA
jgi:hypothetical protein